MENSFECKHEQDLSFHLITSQLWQLYGQRAPGALSAFWHLNPCSCFIQWFVLLGFFPSSLAPHNELQKFQSTEKHLSNPPLSIHFLHALWCFQTSVFDYTKSLQSFVEIWIMLHIPHVLSRRSNWEAQPMPGGGKALSVAPQVFFYTHFCFFEQTSVFLWVGENTSFSQLN